MKNINEYLNNIPTGVRWSLILPAGILGFLIIELLGALLTKFNIPSHYISLFSNLAGHSIFVLFGAIVAPKYRFGIALALTIIVVIISTVSIFFIIKDYLMIEDLVPSGDKNITNSLKSIIEIEMIGKILAIIGSGYITLFVRNHEDKLKQI